MTTTYERPSLSSLQERIGVDLSRIPAILREPLTKALAAVAHGEHGHLDWIQRQVSPLTCELEMLYQWASLYDAPRLMATAAEGYVMVNGNPGTDLLIDTLARGQNGYDYRVVLGVTVGEDGTVSARVRCENAGADTNMLAGQTLTLIDPVAGIDDTLTVGVDGLTGGANEEDLDTWRLRVTDEWQTAVNVGARGGRDDDYRYWAQSAHPSVTTALVYKHKLGIGTVIVMPICNDLTDRIPTLSILEIVDSYIGSKAPVGGDDLSVVSPNILPVTVQIELLDAADTQSNREAITSALSILINSKTTESASVLVSEIDDAISSVTRQYIRHAPIDTVTAGYGCVLTLSVEWL